MALSAQNDIRTTCFENKKFELGLIKNKPSLYYIDISLNELCNDDDKIKEMAEKHMKEYFRGNWKFVYWVRIKLHMTTYIAHV